MDELQKALSQFYPSTSGGIGGGFNSPPGPYENSWILPPYSEDALRRDQPGTHERHERGLFDILSPGGKRKNVVTRKSYRRRICA